MEHAMQEAHKHDDSVHEGISFHGFMRMLAVTRSMDNLDQVTMFVLSAINTFVS